MCESIVEFFGSLFFCFAMAYAKGVHVCTLIRKKLQQSDNRQQAGYLPVHTAAACVRACMCVCVRVQGCTGIGRLSILSGLLRRYSSGSSSPTTERAT